MARRIPAHDIEGIVVRRLQTFLNSGTKVSQAAGQAEDDAHTQTLLHTMSKHHAAELTNWTIPRARTLLMAIGLKVIVNDEAVEMLIDKNGLRKVLLGLEPDHAAQSNMVHSNSSHGDTDSLKLTIDAQLKRCGREMRLILPGESDQNRPTRFDATLIKAIARGYTWYQRLLSGKAISVEALANELGLTKRYVNRIIRCALLAPDIVERILEGHQPPELTLNRLFRDIPTDWSEQRRVFGISAR